MVVVTMCVTRDGVTRYRLNGGALLKQSTVLPWIVSGLGLVVLSINGGKKAKIFFFPQFFVKNTLRGEENLKTKTLY
jgi:hypothetical protein